MINLQEHWKIWFFEGILLLILGLFAIALPQVATLSTELFLGWLLFLGGVFQLVRSFNLPKGASMAASLLGAFISIILGLILILYPLTGIITLTLFLAAYFLIDGILKIFWAFSLTGVQNRELIGFNGLIGIIIAGICFWQWPTSAGWFLGILVGINLIFFGLTLMTLSWESRPKEGKQ